MLSHLNVSQKDQPAGFTVEIPEKICGFHPFLFYSTDLFLAQAQRIRTRPAVGPQVFEFLFTSRLRALYAENH